MILRFSAWLRLPSCLLVLAAVVPIHANSVEIDFTRYLASHAVGPMAADADPIAFFGVPGSARLIVTSSGNTIDAAIHVNGLQVLAPPAAITNGVLEVPITLGEENTIAVGSSGAAHSQIAVRVKQKADVELNVLSRVHFNTNVSDFAAAREFYGKLGLETLSGFPDTNTLEMAQAIGIDTPTAYDGSQGEAAGGYLLHGELVGFGFFGGVIDLIEFTIPRNDEPPYDALNHLGMARAVMRTTNIAADYAYMKEQGVEFISAPATRSDGTQFAIFRDLDGTHYELMAVDGEDEDTETTHIVGLGRVNINVSDFERSRAWYQMLGFEVTKQLPGTESIEVASAMGFDDVFEIEGAIVTHRADRSALELVQWIKPYDPQRAYPVPINHLGIHRMAFSTSDIDADVAALRSQGVEFISDVTPCCSGPDSSGGIVAFYDPDGTIIELVEQPGLSQLLAAWLWLRNLFD